MKHHTGKLTINRITSNRVSDYIEIRLTDGENGVFLLTAHVTPHDLAMALTGLAMVDCTIELGAIANIGKTREQKTEDIVFSSYPNHYDIELEIVHYQVDGWLCSAAIGERLLPVLKNDEWHVDVPFHRFVDKG